MKKTFLAVFTVFFIAFSSNGQEVSTTKKASEAGDWTISVNASPFLNYLGNFIGGGGTNVAPGFQLLSPYHQFSGKYFLEDNKAVRVGLVFNYNSNSTSTEVVALPITSPVTYVNDKSTNSGLGLGLTSGLEYRRGKGRLFGLYGFEGGLLVGSQKTSYSYGNILSNDNPITNRVAYMKDGTTFSVGARAFVGVEYFIFSKISLSGELGWGPEFQTTGKSEEKLESWSSLDQTVEFEIIQGNKSKSAFSLSNTDRSSLFGPSAQMKLSFYF